MVKMRFVDTPEASDRAIKFLDSMMPYRSILMLERSSETGAFYEAKRGTHQLRSVCPRAV